MNETEENLKSIFDNVNYWLSFAEAKNAALIAFGVAWITMLSGFESSNTIACVLLKFSLFSSIVAMLLSFISFSPITQRPKLLEKENLPENRNLIFFKDIAGFESADQHWKELQISYKLGESTENTRLAKDYAEEIYINARIAVNKYVIFKYALTFQIISLFAFTFSHVF